MKNKMLLIFTLLVCNLLYSQDKGPEDIQTPEMGSVGVSSGGNYVQESSGKVKLSIPIGVVNSKSLSYPVVLNYNGKDVFNQAQYLNEYATTGVLGVGWNIGFSKIVCDTKETGTREDDIFYMDGTELLLINKGTNNLIWEFKSSKYDNAIIKYHLGHEELWQQPGSGIWIPIIVEDDYWEIISAKGESYFYGETANSRENVLAWGNWIGDSKNLVGAKQHTVVWNLSKMQDQWDNQINFSFEKVEQKTNSSSSALNHTEAIYIKEISSDYGKMVFSYSNKTSDEIYEPHTEQSEPDAYQERYERKYLNNIKLYNHKNTLQSLHEFNYSINNSISGNSKRYLVNVTQTASGNSNPIVLPPHEFEYYTTGDFKGGIKKVTNINGGSTTYNYLNKTLFTNTDSKVYDNTISSGYTTRSNYVTDKYSLSLDQEGVPSTITRSDERFRIIRSFWDGKVWRINQFIIPELVGVDRLNYAYGTIDNVRFIFGDDYYGVLTYDRISDRGNVYLFHLNEDKTTWNYYEHKDIVIESYDNDLNHRNEDPVFMSGNDFAAIGTNRSGRLYTYTWNGTSWNTKQIAQGNGQYYYAANNNFILTLDEDGQNDGDMITGLVRPDYYYIHYLDAEKNWQSKSWTASAGPYIASIEEPSYFYPSNSMAGFVADDNAELFLRWDTDYNLTNVENIVGSYNDQSFFTPVMNNILLMNPRGTIGADMKLSAFNGSSWSVNQINSGTSNYALGINKLLLPLTSNDIHQEFYLLDYNPNSHNWTQTELINNSTLTYDNKFGVTKNLIFAGKHAFKINSNGTRSSLGSINSYNDSNHILSSSETIYKEMTTYNNVLQEVQNGSLFYLDKETNNLLSTLIIDDSDNVFSYGNSTTNFGGSQPYLSNTTLFVKNKFIRIIDNKSKTQVKDIVLNNVIIDSKNGNTRKIEYNYDNYNSDINNSTNYYNKVTLMNKGDGNGNIGKLIKYFNNGEDDTQMSGLIEKIEFYDSSNILIKKKEFTWNKYTKNYINSIGIVIGKGFYNRNTKTIENLYFDSNSLSEEITNSFDSKGVLIKISKNNSKNLLETTDINYAYQQYPFLLNKNMLDFPYEMKNKIGNQDVSFTRSKWKNENNKYFVYEDWKGITLSDIRLNHQINQIDSNGNIVESYSGLSGINSSSLLGYNELHEVALITNANYQDVISNLDVSYNQFQALTTASLKAELIKLYDRLPNAIVTLKFYNDNGDIISDIDKRGLEMFYYYDAMGRLDYTTDSEGNILIKKEYNFGN